MGRSVFGFKGSEHEPLSISKVYPPKETESKGLEYDINYRAGKIIDDKTGFRIKKTSANQSGGSTDSLGRRYIVISYDENPNNPFHDVSIYSFSNGLYVVEFYTEHQAKREIAEKIFDIVINNLFHLEFNPEILSIPKDNIDRAISLEKYNGLLTYHQIDLLQNYVFNPLLIPEAFFSNAEDNDKSSRREELEEVFSLKSIFRSISLLVTEQDITPLFSDRKRYNLKYKTSIELTEEKALAFVLYLVCVSMEQFTRVSVSQGLIHYKNGLDFCKKSLIKTNLNTKVHKNTGQIYQPSKACLEEFTSYSLLEAYATLAYSKVSGLKYVSALYDDTLDRIGVYVKGFNRAISEISVDDEHGNIESWTTNATAIKDAISQYKRYLDAIHADCSIIYEFIKSDLQSQTIGELSDIRKIQELTHESSENIEIKISNENFNRININLAFWGMLISALQLSDSIIIRLSLLVIASLALILFDGETLLNKIEHLKHEVKDIIFKSKIKSFFYKIKDGYFEKKTLDKNVDNLQSPEVQIIYDFSSLRIKTKQNIDAGKSLQEDITSLLKGKGNYPLILNVYKISGLNEKAKLGYLRRKYSLWLENKNKTEKFILHIEIESIAKSWFITDIRIVATLSQKREEDNHINKTVKAIVEAIVGAIAEKPELVDYRESFQYIIEWG